MKIRKALVALPLLAMGLTGCANLETAPDEIGIRYSGGAIFPEAIDFKECQAASKQQFGDPGDNIYTYPAGQRTFSFSNDAGADSPPLSTSAPSPGGGQPITLAVSGVVTFTPKFDNCDQLRQFHEKVGLTKKAFEPEGWRSVLNIYFKQSTDRAIDNEALRYDWVSLSGNADTKAKWEKDVIGAIPGILKSAIGGDYFSIDNVVLQKPDLPAEVTAASSATEAARQQAATAEQVKKAAESFPGGVNAYMAYQQQQATNEAIRSGNVKVIPVPAGSPIIVSGQ